MPALFSKRRFPKSKRQLSHTAIFDMLIIEYDIILTWKRILSVLDLAWSTMVYLAVPVLLDQNTAVGVSVGDQSELLLRHGVRQYDLVEQMTANTQMTQTQTTS